MHLLPWHISCLGKRHGVFLEPLFFLTRCFKLCMKLNTMLVIASINLLTAVVVSVTYFKVTAVSNGKSIFSIGFSQSISNVVRLLNTWNDYSLIQLMVLAYLLQCVFTFKVDCWCFLCLGKTYMLVIQRRKRLKMNAFWCRQNRTMCTFLAYVAFNKSTNRCKTRKGVNT